MFVRYSAGYKDRKHDSIVCIYSSAKSSHPYLGTFLLGWKTFFIAHALAIKCSVTQLLEVLKKYKQS